MISVSTIKSYMFCPLKLYFQTNIDEESNEDYLTSKTLKDLRIDIQDLFNKNLRYVKKDMEIDEIEKRLSIGIHNQIKATFDIIEEINEKNKNNNHEKRNKEETPNKNYKNNEKNLNKINKLKNNDKIEFIDSDKTSNIPKTDQINEIREIRERNEINEVNEIREIRERNEINEVREKNTALESLVDEHRKIEELKKELINEINLNLKILSLKIAEAMKILDKDGDEIHGLFFPSCMYNYLIRDIGLDLIGLIDKIEVEKGNYFPISLKPSNPPIKGVWDGDLMETIANALLIEQEFNTYVTIGYVDYLKIAERRPVIIDTDARKGFFKVLTHINKIIEEGEIPNVKTSLKKCENCEYKELCEKN